VQRRVDEPDRHRPAGHGLEDPHEILALVGQQLGQGRPTGLLGVGHDHFLDRELPFARGEEHVLGAAQADALGAHLDRLD